MIGYNSDGSIKLPAHLMKKQVNTRNTRVSYEDLLEKARFKSIKILFLVEEPDITENIYAESMEDSPILKIFKAFNIQTTDMNKAIKELLDKGYLIVYVTKKDSEVTLRNSLIGLNPNHIIAIGSQFDKKLGFVREDGRFISEKLDLDENLAKRIKEISARD